MIAYFKSQGRARDLRLVDDDHQPAVGEIVSSGDSLPPIESLNDPAVVVADHAAAAFAAVNASFERAVARLTAGYPQSEMLSWPKQEAEARAWNADNTVATPYIDSLAVTRGIPRALYLQKTYAKVVAFQPASASAIGKRQAGEDAINAAADPVAIGAARDAAVAALDGLFT